VKVLARRRAASIIEIVSARSHVASESGNGGQNMRVHFQQLTEPISVVVDNYELFASSFPSTFPISTQLKSPAARSRRLHVSMTRACGDPFSSAR